MNTKKKKELGQFFTTNYEYILQGMTIPETTKKIIEPFCGNGDLLNFIKNKAITVECYDIDPKKDFIIKRDTLKSPPNYKDTFIITNPPFLARNKSKDKSIFNKYNTNDLFKCFIKSIITNECDGGIIIIPLNFISSIRITDCLLRKEFVSKYEIERCNIFEERVFNDTSYAICSLQFKKNMNKILTFPIFIFPSKISLICSLSDENNYIIGGEIYNLNVNNNYQISRLLQGQVPTTNILLKALDDNKNRMIQLSIVKNEDIYYGKLTSRTYASIQIIPAIPFEKQKEIVEKFNILFQIHRKKYNSLFLTNYRESNTIARKRISFDLAYRIIGHLLL
jgi:hypothetical protein